MKLRCSHGLWEHVRERTEWSNHVHRQMLPAALLKILTTVKRVSMLRYSRLSFLWRMKDYKFACSQKP